MKCNQRKPATCCVLAIAGLALIIGVPPARAQASSQASTLPKRLVADYGYWSRTQTPPYSSDQIPFHKLTHINHAGVNFSADGSLSVPDGFYEPELIEKAHAAGVKVLLLLGGDFGALATNPGIRDILVGNLSNFIRANIYDGLDVDWEYPASTAERKAFFGLLTKLRETFPTPDFVISADVPPWGGSGYDFKGVEPLVDYFNIMMFDCAGPWTDDGQLNSAIFPDPQNPQPWECEPGGSAQEAIDILEHYYHVPPSKLNMGTPFYGYFYTNVSQLFGICANSVNGSNCDYTVLTENYGTFIKQRVNQRGWEMHYHPITAVPYLLRKDGRPGYITYDDPASTYFRVWYSVWGRDLGGTFMWSLDADYDGQSQDLLDAMYSAIKDKLRTAPSPSVMGNQAQPAPSNRTIRSSRPRQAHRAAK